MDEWNAHSIEIQTPEELLIAKSLLIRSGKDDYVLSLSVENSKMATYLLGIYNTHSKSNNQRDLGRYFRKDYEQKKFRHQDLHMIHKM
ncbi:MAG: hypothetical protein R3B93_22395 [Bacteroidia bacterium]